MDAFESELMSRLKVVERLIREGGGREVEGEELFEGLEVGGKSGDNRRVKKRIEKRSAWGGDAWMPRRWGQSWVRGGKRFLELITGGYRDQQLVSVFMYTRNTRSATLPHLPPSPSPSIPLPQPLTNINLGIEGVGGGSLSRLDLPSRARTTGMDGPRANPHSSCRIQTALGLSRPPHSLAPSSRAPTAIGGDRADEGLLDSWNLLPPSSSPFNLTLPLGQAPLTLDTALQLPSSSFHPSDLPPYLGPPSPSSGLHSTLPHTSSLNSLSLFSSPYESDAGGGGRTSRPQTKGHPMRPHPHRLINDGSLPPLEAPTPSSSSSSPSLDTSYINSSTLPRTQSLPSSRMKGDLDLSRSSPLLPVTRSLPSMHPREGEGGNPLPGSEMRNLMNLTMSSFHLSFSPDPPPPSAIPPPYPSYPTLSTQSRPGTMTERKRGGERGRGGETLHNPSLNSSLLQAQLTHSLQTMQHHTILLQEGIIDLHRVLKPEASPSDPPLSSSAFFKQQVGRNGRAFLLRAAGERCAAHLWVIVRSELARGLRSWKLSTTIARREAKMSTFLSLFSLRHLLLLLDRAVQTFLRRRWGVWTEFVRSERERIRREKELSAVMLVQRVYRGHRARVRTNKMVQYNKYQRLYEATVKIQTLFRGCLCKWRYLRHLHSMKLHRAALRIQRTFRGYSARKRVRRMFLKTRMKNSATKLQAWFRGIRGRRRAQRERDFKMRSRLATCIQSMARGFLCRRRMEKRKREREMDRAATIIQKIARGVIVRVNLHRRKREALVRKHEREIAAQTIQSAYRGYRGRMIARIFLLEKKRERRRFDEAATKINTQIRGYLCRHLFQKMKKQHLSNMLARARRVVEVWAEDAQAFFYLDQQTGEAVWEPSKDGYTRADGMLVLQSGQVVEDDRFRVKSALDEVGAFKSLCSECEERTAIKFCAECGDKYCTPCYKTLHSFGSRRKHKPVALGPLDCSECENLLACFWCLSCDEGYCDVCWRKVHSKGKRRFHSYSEVDEQGRIDSHIYTMDGQELSEYDPTHSQIRQEEEERQEKEKKWEEEEAAEREREELQNTQFSEYYGEERSQEEWQTAYDEEGTPYYYNSYTGQSQYENPY